ncbi:hypothetical protein MMC21_002906 [Puttea exsequens]|nr:hypothetical protein [Puttea exsequens]
MGSTIEGLENLAMTATPTFAVQQCVENALAMGFGYPLTTPCSTNDSATLDTKTFTAHEAAAGPTYDFYASYDTSEQLAYPYLPQVPTPNPYAFSDYQTQPWAQPQQHLASISQYTHASSGFSSLQTTAESPEKVHSNTSPEVKRTGTRDLVGMGLYDNEDRDFMSTLNSAASTDPSRDSLGKGLKLEETWEPPKDDDVEEEEEEGYSTEEGEEMDDISPVQATIPPELHTALYPATYGDLSNQSFFFNDEDMFTSESSYGDYLHSQGYQEAAAAAQPKAADHAPGDFLWF